MSRLRNGFTMMELVLVIAILAIILTMATPHLGRFVSNQRLSAAAQTLQLDIMYARAIAISEQRVMVLCPSQSGQHCDDTSTWHTGWIIFNDRNADREWQASEKLFRVTSVLAGVSASSSVFRKRIRFYPNGSAPGTAMTINLCPVRDNFSARAVVIANSGRIRQDRLAADAAMVQCAG
jgi:type IV fimbrial biogenesis protein FimT